MFNNIRTQLLTLAIFPPLLIALTLGLYLGYSRIQDLEQYTESRGRALVQQLGINAAYGINHDKKDLLQNISNAALEENGVRAICFLDRNASEIIHSGPAIINTNILKELPKNGVNKYSNDNIITFIAPVYNNTLTSNLGPDENNLKENLLGWIVVEYNQDNITILKYHYIFIQNLLVILALLITGCLGLFLGKRLIKDLDTINNSVKKIKEGDAPGSMHVHSSNELRLLAKNIDGMAQHLKNEMDDLRHNVEITTNDLKDTIETIEVQNIELNLARKEALTASKIKSEFLANTSHEIRTPLNGILGFTKILKQTALNKQQNEYVDTIQQSSENLLAIINDILDFSKIEAGKLELEDAPLNLRILLEECVSLFAPHAYEKGIEMVLMIYQDAPIHIMGDALRIKQVVSNLISNAVKFTEKGTIAIRVSLDEQTDNTLGLLISVSDTGIGMSAKQQKEIFQAFTQANSSISREYGGTGLGLTIVKKLVELMQDDIKVESAPNEGSTFTFTLKTRLSDTYKLEKASIFKGKSMLIIERHDLANLALKHLLSAWQIHCLCAKSMKEAEILINEHYLDAIIYCLNPGKITDYQLAEIARLTHKNFPLMVLGPHDNEKELKAVKSTTMAIAFKPVTENRFYHDLSDLLIPIPKTRSSLPDTLSTEKTYQSVNVLAVDDQQANLKLLNVLLSDINITVTSATNGKEAIEACSQQVFDIIFMDIQMPILNGITATIIIRDSDSPNKDTPIIAVTAHALADEKETLLNAGMNDYLSKPINEDQLKAMIEKWCAHKISNNDDIIDIDLCLKLANYKSDLAIDMFNMLLENLENDISQINTALKNSDHIQLLELVHKLHGACCYTGLPELRHSAYNLENALKQAEVDTLEDLYGNLANIANNVIEWSKLHNIADKISSGK